MFARIVGLIAALHLALVPITAPAATPTDWRIDLASYGVTAELPTGTGFAYLSEVASRPGTTRQPITLLDYAHTEIDRQISPAAMALLSIAVGQFVGPWLSYIGLITEATTPFMAGFLKASVSSVITQTAAGVVSGGLDIDEMLKGAAFAGLGAGLSATINLGELVGASPNSLLGIPAKGDAFAVFSPGALLDGFGDSLVSASLGVIQNGGSFGDAFTSNFVSFLTSQATSSLQFGVGNIKEGQGWADGQIGGAFLHGLVGCAAFEAAGADCGAGFASSFATELLPGKLSNGWESDPSKSPQENELARRAFEQNRAELIGASVGFFFSSGEAINVSQAGSVSRSQATYNRQLHPNEKETLSRLLGRQIGEVVFDGELSSLTDDELRLLAAACGFVHCADHLSRDDPRYYQRLILQKSGFALIHAKADSARLLLKNATPALGNELTRASMNDFRMNGRVQGGFYYAGTDARLDLAEAMGVDLYGQARAGMIGDMPSALLAGLRGLGAGTLELLGCSDATPKVCEAFVSRVASSIGGTISAIRSIPQYPDMLADADVMTLLFVHGYIDRDTFVVTLADAGRLQGAADALIVGLGAGSLVSKVLKLPSVPKPGGVDLTHPDHPLLSDALDRNGNRLVVEQGPFPTCGQNSCAMMTSSLRKQIDPSDFIDELGAVPTTRLDLVHTLNTNGVTAASSGGMTVANIASLTATGKPVIARIVGNNGFAHWVVVDGVTTRQGIRVVAVRDPHGQAYFSPVATFENSFIAGGGELVFQK